jgi:hypothetical protein
MRLKISMPSYLHAGEGFRQWELKSKKNLRRSRFFIRKEKNPLAFFEAGMKLGPVFSVCWKLGTPKNKMEQMIKRKSATGARSWSGGLRRAGVILALGAAMVLDGGAAEKRHARNELLQEDFPDQAACISADFPRNNIALKGRAIRLGNNANLLFDTDLLRVASGWTGGYITTHGVAYDGAHGAHPKIDGEQKFGTRQVPGWANAKGDFADPRKEPYGPLPEDWCRWDGHYIIGDNVVLSYTVLGTKIFEQPSSVEKQGQIGFVRTFKIAPVRQNLATILCEVEGAEGKTSGNSASLASGNNVTVAALEGAPRGAKLETANGRILLKLAQGTPASLFKVVLWEGVKADQGKFASLTEGKASMVDFQKGGPRHWNEEVTTRGTLNTSSTPDGAYVTDSLTPPIENPWKRRVRFGGFDFFSDGKSAAFCTHDGDVWIVTGIDDRLEHLTWRRFASGMYETLGLAIVNDVIYTSGRDQITRYHDLNHDGEADYYENFNNQYMSTEGFHEFVFDLQRDNAGNFYFSKANPVNSGGPGFGRGGANGTVCSQAGSLFKLSPDGRHLEILARGFRAPNGIGVSPDGQVTTSDNEGTWVPATPINWISKPGQFCGVINNLITKEVADTWTPPLCWLSHADYDNSGGGQVWVTSEHWGPFQGKLLHESYGRSSLFLVMGQKLPNGLMQGGVTRFPLKFSSSVMRARFNRKDGQLYIAGLREWQSNASKITGFDRVRYTGKKVYSVEAMRVDKQGVHLTFTQPLSLSSVTDLQNYSGKRWNYERAEHYGSPEFSVQDGKKQGRDVIDITSAKLSPDGRTVTLQITDLKPVMEESIRFSLTAADGTPIEQEIQHTIHSVPDSAPATL